MVCFICENEKYIQIPKSLVMRSSIISTFMSDDLCDTTDICARDFTENDILSIIENLSDGGDNFITETFKKTWGNDMWPVCIIPFSHKYDLMPVFYACVERVNRRGSFEHILAIDVALRNSNITWARDQVFKKLIDSQHKYQLNLLSSHLLEKVIHFGLSNLNMKCCVCCGQGY